MRAPAPAKINLALVVGPRRADGKHEVATLLQRIDLCDRITVERADTMRIEGFEDDTIVKAVLRELAAAADVDAAWRVRIEKSIPVAAGLAGGSSDAATALRLANETLAEPLQPPRLHELAASVGADVPFFLADGPQLGLADGSELARVDLPQDFFVLVALPHGGRKPSTGEIYARFDARDGQRGWTERRAELLDMLAGVQRPRDLARLPPNDLASSPLADELRTRGAFRADVTGAGPALYGLFQKRTAAAEAARALRARARVWITVPAWYG